MKANHLFQLSVMTAISETQKALNQRYAVTGETFDPFQSDAPDFTLKHQNKTANPPKGESSVSSGTVPNSGAPSRVSAAAPKEIRYSEPAARPSPAPGETLNVFRQEAPKKRPGLTDGLHASELRRAVILSEIIGPPLSRRGR